jgi:hypothetical protein
MADDELTQLREMATSLIEQGVDKWKVNYQILIGLTEGIAGKKAYSRSPGKIMAKKLCSLYMHNDGYSFSVIAKVIGSQTHSNAMWHTNTCRDLIRGDVFGDSSYRLAHKKAQELGIAR